jgi:hypothetical protein
MKHHGNLCWHVGHGYRIPSNRSPDVLRTQPILVLRHHPWQLGGQSTHGKPGLQVNMGVPAESERPR